MDIEKLLPGGLSKSDLDRIYRVDWMWSDGNLASIGGLSRNELLRCIEAAWNLNVPVGMRTTSIDRNYQTRAGRKEVAMSAMVPLIQVMHSAWPNSGPLDDLLRRLTTLHDQYWEKIRNAEVMADIARARQEMDRQPRVMIDEIPDIPPPPLPGGAWNTAFTTWPTGMGETVTTPVAGLPTTTAAPPNEYTATQRRAREQVEALQRRAREQANDYLQQEQALRRHARNAQIIAPAEETFQEGFERYMSEAVQ